MGNRASSTSVSSKHAFNFYRDAPVNDTFQRRMQRLEARFATAAAKRESLLENAIKNAIKICLDDAEFNAQEANKLSDSFTRAVEGYSRDQNDKKNKALMDEYGAASKRYLQEARAILQQISGENNPELAEFQEKIGVINNTLQVVENKLNAGNTRAKMGKMITYGRKHGVRVMPVILEGEGGEEGGTHEGGRRRSHTRHRHRRYRRKRSQTRRK